MCLDCIAFRVGKVIYLYELMLIYGGISPRNHARNLCVLDIPRKVVGKINVKLMEALREEAKKSKKLNSLISSVSNSCLPTVPK